MEPSSFDTRYEIGKDGEVVEHYANIKDAVQAARDLGEGATLYDRMAHRGNPQLWTVYEAGLLRVSDYKPARS